MSLYQFFAKKSKQSDLPDPSGPLSASISPATIKEANDATVTVCSIVCDAKEDILAGYQKTAWDLHLQEHSYLNAQCVWGPWLPDPSTRITQTC